jgi:hypothetical protein
MFHVWLSLSLFSVLCQTVTWILQNYGGSIGSFFEVKEPKDMEKQVRGIVVPRHVSCFFVFFDSNPHCL